MKHKKQIINLISALFSSRLFRLVVLTNIFLYCSAFFMGEEYGDVVMAVVIVGFYFGLPISLLIMCIQLILRFVQFIFCVPTLIFRKNVVGRIVHILYTLISYVMLAWQVILTIVIQIVLLLFAISYGTIFWTIFWVIISFVAMGMACIYFAIVIIQTIYIFERSEEKKGCNKYIF